MTTMVQGSQQRQLVMGTKVDRAAAAVPTSAADQALFTITGGRVIITSIIGEVTVVIGGTTPSMKLIANPTAAGTSSDICSAVAITADAVGNLYGVATVGGALTVLESVSGTPTQGIVVKAGTIDCNISAADSTGSIKWSLTYVPLDDGASVAAA
jgi:hypothetical protein